MHFCSFTLNYVFCVNEPSRKLSILIKFGFTFLSATSKNPLKGRLSDLASIFHARICISKKHIRDVAPPGLNATVHSRWKYQWLQDHTESLASSVEHLRGGGRGDPH